MQTEKTFHLYRLRHKESKHDAFDTWFTTPRKAFAPMKAKHNWKYVGDTSRWDPKLYEAVEYLITETRTINVDLE